MGENLLHNSKKDSHRSFTVNLPIQKALVPRRTSSKHTKPLESGTTEGKKYHFEAVLTRGIRSRKLWNGKMAGHISYKIHLINGL